MTIPFRGSHPAPILRRLTSSPPSPPRRFSAAAVGVVLSLLFGLSFAGAGSAEEVLGSGQLVVAGARLLVSPESQTVPFDTPTLVETHLVGFDPAAGEMPQDLRVLADFTGPEVDGVLPLETTPGEPFRIPRLRLKGEYRLDDIRLVQGDQLLAYAAPRSSAILVTQVLVTRVTSRPMTLEEIQSRGIALDEDSFRAFSFTFGFAVDGEVVDYNVPVVFNPVGPGDPFRLIEDGPIPGGSRGTLSERFRPPQMAPFTLELESAGGGGGGEQPNGGCELIEGCRVEDRVSLPGVILFPTDVSLLHQFFSVVLFAKNDAPGGDALVIRDLTAKVVLPPGLRLAQTEPPTPLGVPVPVRVPGPDGKLGTADDVRFLVAQATGQAEAVTEGLTEGTHIVDFELEGVLDGLPGGQVRRLKGHARGAVLVRDPTLGVTLTHPDVVRTDEEYSLVLTVSNTSNAPVNLVQLTLPASRLSGVQVVGSNTQTIPELAPGESEVVEFRLRSLRTGRVVASSVRDGGAVDPTFEFAVGVGDAGIPLSPTSIILPRAADDLPDEVRRHALGLVGLGFSLATAPPSLIDSTLPRIGRSSIDEKVYWLAQAGRHVRLGEEPFDSLAVLAAEWTGARAEDWEWDALRRVTQRGGLLGDAFSQIFEGEAALTSETAAFERFAGTTAFLGPLRTLLADGTGASLEVLSRATGKTLAGTGLDPERRRELPFADLYDLGGAQMVLLASPEESGYRVLLRSSGGATALEVVLPGTDGSLRKVRWSSVSLGAQGVAELILEDAAGSLVLAVDSDGDGIVDSQVTGTETTLAPRPFEALAAVQNAEADPSGHVLEVLFSADIDLASLLPVDPQRFRIPGKVSNGGLVQVEKDLAVLLQTVSENPFEGLRDSRIVRVLFNNPLSPYTGHQLTVENVDSASVAGTGGETVATTVLPVTTTVTAPGTLVEGTVYGPDGFPAPFSRVDLYEVDPCFVCLLSQCKKHRTAAVQADAAGRFTFDYVRQTTCSDVFTIEARDPASGKHGTATNRVRFIGQTVELDVRMLGRGTIRGRVTYEDGTVPASLRVVANSPVFAEGRQAVIGTDGTFEVGDVPVGTVTLAASDTEGSFVFQTVEIPTAGAVVQRDLIIIRRSPDLATGDVRGTVFETDGTTPVYDAYVALYVDDQLMGVRHSDGEGGFDFGTVPTGQAEIEAFDGETGRRGTQVFFDVQPDQVNAVTLLLRDDRGTVEGHVYRQAADGTSTPLAGAVVWVSGTPFNTTTDAAGFYRLEDVFAGNRKMLAADLEREEQTSATVTVNGDGSTVYRDLFFIEDLEGSGLAGEVVDYAGNPVVGAFIHLSAGGDRWYREAFTDSNGRWVLPDLGPGTYEVYAYRGVDGATKRATIRFEGETPFVRIQFKKGTIRGTVRARNEAGQAVGVRSLVTYRTTVVQAGLIGLDWEPRTLETADDGSFEIPNVLAGPYTLTVSNAFHGEKTLRGELIDHGEVVERDILFERNGTIRGTVLDWDGVTPVAGAQVFLRHPDLPDYDLTSGEDGSFTFELVPPSTGRFPLDVTVEQGAVFRKARVWVRFDKFGQELDVEVVLPKQGTVTGFVEDASGYPVPGAVVTLRESSYPHRALVGNTDGEGYFSFTNVFEGRVALSAKAPSLGGLGGRTRVEVIDEGEEVFGLISLEATAEITGQVINPADGEPVSSAAVTLYRWGTGRFDRVNADADGRFRFRLLPLDMYRVWVFDPTTGRHGSLDGLVVELNEQVVDTVVPLEVRGEVDGHLSESSGTPVPGATIKLITDSQVDLKTFSSTDVDGYFEFLGIPEGSFTLSTQEPGGRRKAKGAGEIVEEGERVTVDLELEAAGRVMGSVLNPPGAPAGLFANVNVLLEQSGQVIGASLANPFAFDGVLEDKKFTLTAREVGGDHRARATGTLRAEDGGEIIVDLEMVPIGNAEVSVIDSFGAAVSGADVNVTNSGFYSTKKLSASTGGDGTAFFSGLGEGSVSVSATNPLNGLKGSGNGELALDGETVAVAVQLQDSGSVSGRVLLSDGVTPALDALVVLTRGSRTLQARIDENGDFAFAVVPLGSFQVYVQENLGPGLALAAGSLATNGDAIDVGTLVLDDYDPYVETLTPATGSRDVPLASAVVVTFNEPLDPARYTSSWFRFRKLSGGSVSYSATWADGDRTVILTPSGGLASFKGYEVTVQDAVDLSGRHLFERVRTVFYTVDVVPPTVVRVDPRDGEKQVPVDANIRVTFSEPLDPASPSGSAFQLTDLTSGQGLGTTWVLEADNREVLLTPVGGLATDRQYQLSVSGVRDGSGNTMTQAVTTTFWSLDTVPPSIDDIAFPAGTAYTSGDDVPVTVTASDLHGVARVEATIGGWTFTDTAAPWDLSLIAPVVSAPETLTITFDVTDVHGNTATTTRDVQVAPLVNASAPVVDLGCARDGDHVVPSVEALVELSATDDGKIESYSFLVDGVKLEGLSPVHSQTTSSSFEWAPPAAAAPGTVYELRLEARDYAGNVGSAQVSVVVPTGTVLKGGRSLFDTFAGQTLTVAEGDFIVREPLSVESVFVVRGARLTSRDQDVLGITASQEIRVQCGAAISATGGGYAGGTASHVDGWVPDGIVGSHRDAGGSHGGVGVLGNWTGPAGEVYDSVYVPHLAGGGGSYDGNSDFPNNGRPGGGVIDLDAAVLRVEGTVEARGSDNNDWRTPAGAGGSVRVRAGLLSGTGSIDANGGQVNANSSTFAGWEVGSGGGGRVVVEAAAFESFDPLLQVRAWGGRRHFSISNDDLFASPGTVLIKGPGSDLGTLQIDPGVESDGEERLGEPTVLPALGAGTVSATEVSGADLLVTASSPFLPRWLGAWLVALDGSGNEIGTFRVAEVLADGRLRLEGAVAASGAASYRGEYRFDTLAVGHGGALVASDPLVFDSYEFRPGTARVGAEIAARTVTVRSGAIVRPLDLEQALRFRVTETMTVEAGGLVDVTGFGYSGGHEGHGDGYVPEGISPPHRDFGGSHGGVGIGGNYVDREGEVFDSVYRPRQAGGGGAYDGNAEMPDVNGRRGGGVLSIEAGSLVLDGELRARGTDNFSMRRPAGAGGTVMIEAGSIEGSGLVDASGGDIDMDSPAFQTNWESGSGGGGRVGLVLDVLGSFEPRAQIRAWGGKRRLEGWSTAYAAPGTVLVETLAAPQGLLIVDAGETSGGADRSGPITTLPALGSGAISAVEVAAGDLWVQATTPLLTRWLGAWMILEDGGGAQLGAFRVVDLDAQGRVLLEGAAAVLGATSYHGEYRFDSIEVLNGAGLEASDPMLAGDTVLDGVVELSTEVVADSLVVRSGAVVRPAAGVERLDFRISGPMTVEAGARIDVSGHGYPGGDDGHGEGYVPEGVTGPLRDFGGSHGGEGTGGNYADREGEVYDSVYRPRYAGGGGSYDGNDSYPDHNGRPGGGILTIEADSLVLDGELRARGYDVDDWRKPAGAGGTIWVTTPVFSGGGFLDASGGDAISNSGYAGWELGSGGGGRIGLLVGSLSGFDIPSQTRIAGGTRQLQGWPTFYGGSGTVFVHTGSSTYGDLWVDDEVSGSPTIGKTPLPAIGKGVVGTATPQGADLWIEPADPAKLHSLGVEGMWVRIAGVDYRVLAENQDRRGLLLEGADGAVAPGDAYVGVYKFDKVTVAGGAHLHLDDDDEVGEWVVDANSTVELFDLDPPVVTLDAPALPASFASGQLFQVAVTATDNTSIDRVVLRWDGSEIVDDTAPYEWILTAPEVVETTDLPLEIEAFDDEENSTVLAQVVTVSPAQPGDLPELTVADQAVVELDAGDITTELVVTLDQGWDVPVSVDWALLDGSALAGEDYQSDAGTLVFAPGETQLWIPLTVHGDTLQEGDETVQLVFSSPSGIVLAATSVLVPIVDDDGAHCFGPELMVNGSAEEPLVGGQIPGWIEVTGNDWQVKTQTDTGWSGSSFFFAGDVASGELMQTVDVSAYGALIDAGSAPALLTGYYRSFDQSTPDSTRIVVEALAADQVVLTTFDTGDRSNVEAWKQFAVRRTLPAGTRELRVRLLSQRGAVGTQNDGYFDAFSLRFFDVPHVVTGDVSVTEGDTGTVMASVPVLRSCGLDQSVSVAFATADGSAVAGLDYAATSGTVTFAVGESSASVEVEVDSDTLVEGDETFELAISDASPGTVILPSSAIATVTIIDDETLADTCKTPNLLRNGDAEEELVGGELPGWVEVLGSEWKRQSGSTPPFEGTYYLSPGGQIALAELRQDVDVSGFGQRIAAGVQQFYLQGYVRAYDQSPPDLPRIIVEYRDATNQTVLGSFDSGPQTAQTAWKRVEDLHTAPVGTGWIRVRLIAERGAAGNNNDGYFDALELVALAAPYVEVGALTIDEGAVPPQGNVPVTLGCYEGPSFTVDYQTVVTSEDTATPTSDFEVVSGQLTLGGGVGEGGIPVTVVQDLFIEGDETFSVTLDPADPDIPVVGRGLVTIIDDDSVASACKTPNLLRNGDAEEELIDGEVAGWVEVTGAEWTRRAGGTGLFPGAFYHYPGVVTFGELSQDVDVSGFASRIDAGSQQFLFQGYVLSYDQSPADRPRIVVEYRDASNQTILATYDSGYQDARSGWRLLEDLRFAPAGTRWIRVRLLAQRNSGNSNDSYFDDLQLVGIGTPYVVVTPTTFDEGSAPYSADVPVTMGCYEGTPLVVDYQTAVTGADTATSGADFTAVAGQLTLDAGNPAQAVSVPVLQDSLVEGDETFSMLLTPTDPFVAIVGPSVFTITDDDSVSEACQTPNLLRNGGAEEPLVAGDLAGWTDVQGGQWTTRSDPNPAYEGNNYFYAGLVALGELRQDVDVSSFATGIASGQQQFHFQGWVLSNNETSPDLARIIVEYRDSANQTVLDSYDSGYQDARSGWMLLEDLRAAPMGTSWIRVRLITQRDGGTGNDGYFDALELVALDAPHVAVGSVQIAEGDPAPQAYVPVTVGCYDGPSFTVDYQAVQTGSDTATSGLDFVAASGQLTLGGGVTEQSVPVSAIHDWNVEGDETFSVTLTSSDPDVPPAGHGVVTIVDDDTTANTCKTPNLLANGGGEEALVDGEVPGWTEVTGSDWSVRSSPDLPYEGSAYFWSGLVALGEMRQDVDVSAFAQYIAAGSQQFLFQGYVKSYNQSPADKPRIIVEYRDATNSTVLGSYDSGYLDARSGWMLLEDLRFAPAGTSWIRVRLLADRNAGSGNDGYFDALQLVAVGTPHLAVTPTTFDESAAPVSADVTVTLGCYEGPSVTVDYQAATLPGDTAVLGEDFEALSGQWTLGGGTDQATAAVTVLHDRLVEGDEVFSLALTPSDAGVIVVEQGPLTILDDDTQVTGCLGPELLVNGSGEDDPVGGEIPGWTEVEGDEWARLVTSATPYDGAYFIFPGMVASAELRQDVDLSTYSSEIAQGRLQTSFEGWVRGGNESPPDQPRIIVEYRSSDGSVLAAYDSGFVDTPNVWLGLGEARAVPVGTVAVRVRLLANRRTSSSNNAYFDAMSLKPVLLPEISVGAASVVEGDSGTSALVFPVTASCASDTAMTASYATVEGTATEGVDYTAASGTVTLAAGETATTLSVDVIGDTAAESDEELSLELSQPDYARLDQVSAVGTITDDDSAGASRAAGRPRVELQPCPRELDVVAPGQVIELGFDADSAGSGGAVAARLRFGGAVVAETLYPERPEHVEGSLRWQVPETATPGELLVLRLVVLDAAGRRGVAVRQLRVAAGTVLEGALDHAVALDQGLVAGLLAASEQGSELVLGAGSFVVTGPLDLDGLNLLDLTMLDGARLSAPAGEALELRVRGALRLQCGAILDHSGGGYGASTGLAASAAVPPGVEPAHPDAGGSHGGLGSVSGALAEGAELAAGEAYDSLFDPSLGGGAGARGLGGAGLPGGGVVILDAGEMLLDGEILARGLSGAAGRPAGAGGAVSIRTGELSGAGHVDVSGGSASACSAADVAGAGGGGRVALESTAATSFDLFEQVLTGGGALRQCDGAPVAYAGAGTAFLRVAGARGTLAVIQPGDGSLPVAPTPLPRLGSGVVGSVTVERARAGDVAGALWIELADPERRFDLGLWGLGIAVGGDEYLILDQSADRRRLLLAGAVGRVEAGDVFAGAYRFDRLVIRGGARLEIDDGVAAESVELDDGSSLVRGPDREPAPPPAADGGTP